jgi:protein MpaA
MDRERSVVARIGLLATLLLGLAGCYEAEPKPRITGEQQRAVLPPARMIPKQVTIGRTVKDRPILIQVVGQGADTALIMGAIHGDEPIGTTLVEQLGKHLRDNPQLIEGRRVVLLPTTNPDGVAAHTRVNAHGVDLNRNFDTSNRVDSGTNGLKALTEPEAQALQSLIKDFAPSRIVSIHSPLNCIDYDGPGQALAARMAQDCDLEVKKLGARPGSLGSYTGETLGIPTVTLELPPEATRLSDYDLWQKYGKALVAAVMYPDRAP